MSSPARSQILKLYKELLKYGQQLTFTDKPYYVQRIKKEFVRNKELTEIVEINYNFKKGLKLLEKRAIV